MKDKDLKIWRDKKLVDYKSNHDLVTKNFLTLCRIIKSIKGCANVQTPYGQIVFHHNEEVFSYTTNYELKAKKK